MKENLVTFETAKLAFDKNFLLATKGRYNYYNYKGELNGDCIDEIKEIVARKRNPNHKSEIDYSSVHAPTQSLLQQWLRVNYDIDIQTYPIKAHGFRKMYACLIEYSGSIQSQVIGDELKYEDALEKALQVALKRI